MINHNSTKSGPCGWVGNPPELRWGKRSSRRNGCNCRRGLIIHSWVGAVWFSTNCKFSLSSGGVSIRYVLSEVVCSDHCLHPLLLIWHLYGLDWPFISYTPTPPDNKWESSSWVMEGMLCFMLVASDVLWRFPRNVLQYVWWVRYSPWPCLNS